MGRTRKLAGSSGAKRNNTSATVEAERYTALNRYAPMVIGLIAAILGPIVSVVIVNMQSDKTIDEARFTKLYDERKAAYAKLIADVERLSNVRNDLQLLSSKTFPIPDNAPQLRKYMADSGTMLATIVLDMSAISFVGGDKTIYSANLMTNGLFQTVTDLECGLSTGTICKTGKSASRDEVIEDQNNQWVLIDQTKEQFLRDARAELVGEGN
ncbi:hypothetical protein AB4Z14_18390 [Terrabacter sp. 2TAF16]|uniref:hypothetical protein n=1 Tax=Terrabacter sp. 2TAF16 TaxID=3233008 RepID=UPI003F96A8CF